MDRQMTDPQIDEALRRFLSGHADVLANLAIGEFEMTDRVRVQLTAKKSSRRLQLLLVAVLLLASATAIALAAGSGILPVPWEEAAPYSIVVEHGNDAGDFEEYVTTHQVIEPSTGEQLTALADLPDNAVLLRWSPDGSRLTYFEQVATSTYEITGLFVADADGSNRMAIELMRHGPGYGQAGSIHGAVWAPTSEWFALLWNAYTCTEGPSCLPDIFIDVFDRDGQAVTSIPVSDGLDPVAQWSPDGQRIGWQTGSCEANSCQADAFNSRLVIGSDEVRTVTLPAPSSVTWSTGDRLLVLELAANRLDVARVYSMASDGGDVREVAWEPGESPFWPAWSPDGRWLAVPTNEGTVVVRNPETGEDTLLPTPRGASFVEWAPDGERLVVSLYPAGAIYQSLLYVINVDGSNLQVLGEGQDVTWMPLP